MRTRNGREYTMPQVPNDLSRRKKHAGAILRSVTEGGTRKWRAGPMVIPTGALKGRISKRWPQTRPVKSTASKGLFNRANHCYRNALLQCLLHTPKFYHYLGNIHRHCHEVSQECAVCALQRLVQFYWNDLVWPQNTQPLRRHVKRLDAATKHCIATDHPLYNNIIEDQQTDPHEFIECLLDGIRAKHDCPSLDFEHIFKGTIQAKFICEDCGQNNALPAPADQMGSGFRYGISVPVHEPEEGLALVQYLRVLFSNQTAPLKCSSALCNDTASKPRDIQVVYTDAPEILTIRLQRFRIYFDEDRKYQEKVIDADVDLEEFLDIGEFTDTGDNVIYRLEGVVAHDCRPDALRYGGHYIAAVRQYDGRTFCTLNDDQASQQLRGGTLHEMYWPRSYKADFKPYMLVYSKI